MHSTTKINPYEKYLKWMLATNPNIGIAIIKIKGITFLKNDSFRRFEVNTLSHILENTTEEIIPPIINICNPNLFRRIIEINTLVDPSNTRVIACNSFLYNEATKTIRLGRTAA